MFIFHKREVILIQMNSLMNSKVDFDQLNTSKSLTGSFVLISVLISITTTAQSIGVGSSNLWNAIQAVILLIIILYDLIVYDLAIKYDYVIYLLLVLMVAGINRAAYMISLTMMLVLIMMVEMHGSKIDFNSVLKTYAITSIVFFGVVVLGYLILGFNSSKDISMWRIDRIINRSSLGFNQPNVADMNWLAIVITMVGVFRKRLVQVVLVLFTLLIYYFTLSRTSTIILVFTLLCLILLGKKQDKFVPCFFRKLLALGPIVLFLVSLSFIITHNYSDTLNSLLSGRLALYRNFYATYGIHFLSTPQLENAMFDNSYLQALLSKGIFFCSALLVIYVKLALFSKRMTWKSCLLYLTIILLGITETALQHFDLFFPLVMLIGKYDYYEDPDKTIPYK